MPKYRKPVYNVTEEPKFFVKHYMHAGVEGVKTHKDTLLTALLVVAIAFLGLVIWHRYTESAQLTAWGAVSTSGTLPELEGAVSKYASMPAASFLKLRLADRYIQSEDIQKGSVDKAISLYKDVAASTKGDLALRAEYSLGFALESQGKFDEAKKAFETTAAEAKTYFGKIEADGGFWAVKANEALKDQDARKVAAERLSNAQASAKATEIQNALMNAARGAAAAQPAQGVESSGTQESQQSQEIQSGAAPAVQSTAVEPLSLNSTNS
jgi:tetratricopeptide (TPR) repeat protein